ncbi:leucine-rich repeat domain-containing protein [Flavobacterium sp.]|uniref:leucine-rich repeat domain-containing protein n=1 Tax=Flavobacterium sp. TaxID=239 RepID=UPI0039E484C5
MTKQLLFAAVWLTGFHAAAQNINFPDPVFKAKLLEADVTNNLAKDINNDSMKIDADSDGEISEAEALAVYWLFYTTPPPPRPAFQQNGHSARSSSSLGITDVTGISYFTNLRKLNLRNNLLTNLDVSALVNLDRLDCAGNELATLDVQGSTNLEYLECNFNHLTELQLDGLTNLKYLYCGSNELTALDFSNLENLIRLGADNNLLTTVQFGNNEALERVYLSYNNLVEIDLSSSIAWLLHCDNNPDLTSVNLKNSVDSPFELDEFPLPVQSFNFSNTPMLANICGDTNEISVIEQALAGQPGVSVTDSCLPSIVNIPDVNFKNKLLNTNCASFVDGVPSDSYTSKVDTNEDGEIQLTEALAVKGLKVDTSIMTTAGNLQSIEGLQYFTNLQRLSCNGNDLVSLDVTMMPDLLELNCHHNDLTSIDFSGLAQLEMVRCDSNNIASMPLDGLPLLRVLNVSQSNLGQLDATMLPALETLKCDSNQLTSLEIHDLSALREVSAFNNLLSSIDLNGLAGLRILGFGNNLFTSFDLSPLPGLEQFDISSNAISEIDLSGHANLDLLYIGNTLVSQIDCSNTGIRYLKCAFNPNLTSINLKNGAISVSDGSSSDIAFVIAEVPLLTSICIDDNESEEYSVFITDYNTTGNVTVYTGEDCLTEVVMSTTGFNHSKEVVVYPNPTKDRLTIEANGNTIETIVVFNSLGQKVINPEPASSIDVSRLAAGTYFLKVTTENGQLTQKFIKL